MKNQTIIDWEWATIKLVKYFVRRYFSKEATYYWVAEEIGGTAEIAEYRFSTDDMLNFIRYQYTRKQMFEYYDFALDAATHRKIRINIKNWKKLQR